MTEPTAFDLERMALGEIPTPPELEETVAELRADNAEILQSYRADEYAPQIQRRAAEHAPPRRPGRWAGPAVLAGLAVLLAAIFWSSRETTVPRKAMVPGEDGEVRLKGPDIRLQLWRKTDGDQELLDDGAEVSAGDVIQAKYGVAAKSHGVLFSIDGTGTTTLHLPTNADGDTAIEPGEMTATPYSYELDAAPEFERFHFVVCDEQFEVSRLVERFAAGEVEVPDDCSVKTIELKK